MAYVLSSVSGNLISAASAGFAPTNSADVSAIASAYQVVSATATQLNAGTAYLTSVNDTPISASRAGNAANASLANSAWYDGTGRFISSLPDEATVSSIASAYSESAASSKMDESGMSAYLPFSAISADENSAITSINGSSVGVGQVVTSITTGGYGVRAINGMSINASHMVLGAAAADNTSNVVQLGNGDYGAGVFLTGSFGTAYYKVNELQLNRNGTGFIGFNIGGAGSRITATSIAGGKFSAGGKDGARSYFTAFNASASASIEVTGSTAMINIADTGYTSTIYPSSIPYWNAKLDASAIECDTASAITAIGGSSIGGGVVTSIGTIVDGWGNTEVNYINGCPLKANIAVFDDFGNEIVSTYQPKSAMSGYIPTSESANYYPASNPSGFITSVDLSDYATTSYVDSSVSSKLDTTAFSTVSGNFLTAVPAEYATESYVDSAVSGKLDVTASSQFLTSLPDDLAYTSDVASAVSGKLDASASSDFYPMTGNPSGFLTAHQSLVGYATETYVDGAVSGKLDTTAYDSGSFYPTSNPSGFITGVDLSNYATTDYVDSSVSGKQDSSAMTAYVEKTAYDNLYSAFTALSDVISTYSGYFSSISAKVDNSAIGVIE